MGFCPVEGIWQLSCVCAAVVIYNRIVLWRFCVQLFVFQFLRGLTYVSSLQGIMFIAFFVSFDVVIQKRLSFANLKH